MEKPQEEKNKNKLLMRRVPPLAGYVVIFLLAGLLLFYYWHIAGQTEERSADQDVELEVEPENMIIDQLVEIEELEEAGESDAAVEGYKQLLEAAIEPSEKITLHNNIARNYLNDRNYESAVQYAQKSLEIEPREDTFVLLALINVELQDLEQAIDYYRQALDLHKTREEVDFIEVNEIEQSIQELEGQL